MSSDGPALLLTHSDTQDIIDPIIGQQVGSLIQFPVAGLFSVSFRPLDESLL